LSVHSKWGYSVLSFLSAKNKTDPKYAFTLRNEHNMSFKEINRILNHIPKEIQNYYKTENVKRLLEMIK
jgi:hypothetical protein